MSKSAEDRGHYRRQTFVLRQDRKSTRLNSSHLVISYAVFCLKKKKNNYDAVHQNIDGLAEINIEQRFKCGEFKDLAFLKQPVKAALAQTKQQLIQCRVSHQW